jgi:hypothetical protein
MSFTRKCCYAGSFFSGIFAVVLRLALCDYWLNYESDQYNIPDCSSHHRSGLLGPLASPIRSLSSSHIVGFPPMAYVHALRVLHYDSL